MQIFQRATGHAVDRDREVFQWFAECIVDRGDRDRRRGRARWNRDRSHAGVVRASVSSATVSESDRDVGQWRVVDAERVSCRVPFGDRWRSADADQGRIWIRFVENRAGADIECVGSRTADVSDRQRVSLAAVSKRIVGDCRADLQGSSACRNRHVAGDRLPRRTVKEF